MRHDAEAIRDLKQETLRALRLTHPHIVRVHDFVEDATLAGITMELVDGRSLAQLKAVQPHGCFEPAEILAWLPGVCTARLPRGLAPTSTFVLARVAPTSSTT